LIIRIKMLSLIAHVAALGLVEEVIDVSSPLSEIGHPPNTGAFCDTTVQQYSGYMNLTTGDKHLFYWFFASRSAPSTDPVVLWLTGGPGCSSEVALFGENGPCKVSLDGQSTTSNAASWNSHANLLYVDQPVGTGFSYGTAFDHDEVGVGNDMYSFLQAFLNAHPSLRTNDFYVFGESYAGHYVPNVAHRIWSGNQNAADGAHIQLRGMSVGNGLTDPEVQYAYYPAMAVSTNQHQPAVSNATFAQMQKAVPGCVKAIKGCNGGKGPLAKLACIAAYETCNSALMGPYQMTGMNPYDMRIKCAKPPLCYDFSGVGKFLARPEVRAALNIRPDAGQWQSCNFKVNHMFMGDWMKDYQTQIPDLLANGIKVLIYAGDQDFICNWLGNQAWTKAMEWPGKAAFNKAPLTPWQVAGKPAGELWSASNMSFLRVYAAGHMVPLDQPANSLAMLDAFIAGKL